MKLRLILAGCVFLFILSAGLISCVADADRELTLSELMRERTNQLQALKQSFENDKPLPEDLQEYGHFAGSKTSREALDEPGVQGQLKAFETFYARFVSNPDPETYNIVVKTCISCHERLCPGPLRLIRSLSLEPVPDPGFIMFDREND